MCIDGMKLTSWFKCAVLVQEVHSRDNLNILMDKFQDPATPTQINAIPTTKLLTTLICQYEMRICTFNGIHVH